MKLTLNKKERFVVYSTVFYFILLSIIAIYESGHNVDITVSAGILGSAFAIVALAFSHYSILGLNYLNKKIEDLEKKLE